MSNNPGTLFVVATPIGNLADITLRALQVLADVDLIAAEDTRHTRQLLRHHGIDNRLVALHEHNERTQSIELVAALRAGKDLALVSDAGTPLISDPGYPLVSTCRELGIHVSPVPGPSALAAALSVAGLPTERFRFEGFAPRKGAARRDWIGGWAATDVTLVFYESAHRIEATLADLLAVLGPGRRAVIARELTKRFETVLTGTLDELAATVARDADQHRGEFVVLIEGCAPTPDAGRLDAVLAPLLNELPVRQAAALAARIAGVPRNAAYARALELKSD